MSLAAGVGFALAMLAMAGAGVRPAAAAPRVQVSPVLIEIEGERRIASLRVKNASDAPAAFHASAMAWAQENGADRLSPAGDLVVSPPAFVIGPGATQVVRVGASAPHPIQSERAYRLLLRETKLDLSGTGGGAPERGLNVRLEISLPVFVAPPQTEPPPAPAVVLAAPGVLRIHNRAKRHLRLGGLEGAGGPALPRYLLAGADLERAVGPELNAAGQVRLTYTPAGAQEPLAQTYPLVLRPADAAGP